MPVDNRDIDVAMPSRRPARGLGFARARPLLTCVPMLRSPLSRAVLVVTLAGASSSACLNGPCSCPNGGFQIIFVPAALDVQIMASGPGCPGPATCGVSVDGGACTEWFVPTTHAGACTVIAQAADGQQATLTVNVRGTDSCCGTLYSIDPPGAFASFPNFSVADAGTPDGD